MNAITSDIIFRAVYSSLDSLPNRQRTTSDDDIRQIEALLGMPPKTIGAPLWVSGDFKRFPNCDRSECHWTIPIFCYLTRSAIV